MQVAQDEAPEADPTSKNGHRILLWSAIFTIIAVSLLSFLSAQRLQALVGELEKSQNVLLGVSRVVSALKDVETGTRGYMIAGDATYLEPYRAGLSRYEERLGQLRALVAGDASLEQRLRQLDETARQRIRISARIVEVTARGAAREAERFEPAGRRAMDGVRDHARGIVELEKATVRERQRSVSRQAWLTNGGLILGVLASLGIILWLFAARGREVSRRRRAEAELRTLNADLEGRVESRTAELRRSRELLDAVMENLPETVFLKDLQDEGRYLFVNAAGEKLFGRRREELVGRIDHELFPTTQADHCVAGDLEEADSRRPRAEIETHETEQGMRVLESNKVPIAGPGGRPQFLLGIVRDITEQRELEDQLRQMQRMDAVGQLTGGVAHDFNNILTIIMNSVEVLKDVVEHEPEMREVSDDAIGAVLRGADLVRRLLAFARMQRLEPSSVNLNERLVSISPLLQRTLGERISLKVRPSDTLWHALVDPTQVDDAVVNLAINARDAMGSGGGTLSIETGNATLDEDYAAHHLEVTPGDYVMLAVSDTGTGMKPEVIARAFEPFFTTKPVGAGTGLGLSQVYGWVKQSGGHIKIYSEEGHGTTIKLYLPRAEAAAEAPEAPLPADEIASGNETILLVEDNPNVRKTLARHLASLGYVGIEAADGAEALRLVRSGLAFDLLLTDIVMPGGMTGYQLATKVRELRPGMKMLFTSGYTELAAEDEELRRARLLSKPYRKQELGAALRAVLDEEDDPAG